MNKTNVIKVLDSISPILSEDYDIIHFNPTSIYAESNMIGISCNLDFGFKASVRGIELIKLLKKMSGDEVEFKLTDKTLSVKGGGLAAKFKKYDKEKTPPDFTELEFKEVPDNFLEAIIACLPSVSDKDIQGILTGLHIDNALMYGCNNVSVTEYEIPDMDATFTLPKQTASLLTKFNPKYYHITDNKVIFANEDKTSYLWSVLMAGAYPVENMVKLLSKEGDVFSLPEEIGKRADIVSLFAYDAQDGSSFIEVDIQPDKIVLGGNKSFGNLEDVMEYKSEGNVKFHVNSLSLNRALLIDNKFTYCGNFIVFENDKVRHLVCLVDHA